MELRVRRHPPVAVREAAQSGEPRREPPLSALSPARYQAAELLEWEMVQRRPAVSADPTPVATLAIPPRSEGAPTEAAGSPAAADIRKAADIHIHKDTDTREALQAAPLPERNRAVAGLAAQERAKVAPLGASLQGAALPEASQPGARPAAWSPPVRERWRPKPRRRPASLRRSQVGESCPMCPFLGEPVARPRQGFIGDRSRRIFPPGEFLRKS